MHALEMKLVTQQKEKEEMKTDFNHLLRKSYLKISEEKDIERKTKYPTLEDYSDPIEREIETLRQKRGDTRYLTDQDWREVQPRYWFPGRKADRQHQP